MIASTPRSKSPFAGKQPGSGLNKALSVLGFLLAVGLLWGCAPQELIDIKRPSFQSDSPLQPISPLSQRALADSETPANVCLMGTARSIDIDKPQGDLLGWSPQQGALAYIAPMGGQSSGWFLGDLAMITDQSTFQTYAMPNIGAFGDITWSPNGQTLAYVAFRFNDQVYTIVAISMETGKSTDLLPGLLAKSDQASSSKGIVRWLDDSRLLISTSCELDCVQFNELNVRSGAMQPAQAETVRRQDDDSLIVTRKDMPESQDDPLVFAADWSADEQYVAYFDADDYVFVNIDKKKIPLGVTYSWTGETKWSADAQYLAVRIDEKIFVYDVSCLQDLP